MNLKLPLPATFSCTLPVHRSYIVSFSKIGKLRNKTIYIGEKEIPIGSSYEEEFMKLFK